MTYTGAFTDGYADSGVLRQFLRSALLGSAAIELGRPSYWPIDAPRA